MDRHRLILLVTVLVALLMLPLTASGQFPHTIAILGGDGTDGEDGHQGLSGDAGEGGQPSADSAVRNGQDGQPGGHGGDGGEGGDGGSGTWFISGTVYLGAFSLNIGGIAGQPGMQNQTPPTRSGAGGDGGFANWPGFAAGEDGYRPDGLTDQGCGQGSTATDYPGGDAVWENRGGGGGSSGPGVFSQIMSAGGDGSDGHGDSGGNGADGYDGQDETFRTYTGQYLIVPQNLILGGRGGNGGSSGQYGYGGGGGGGAGGGGDWPAGLGGLGGWCGKHGRAGTGGDPGIGQVILSGNGTLHNNGLVVIAAQSQVRISDAGSSLDNQEGILILPGGLLSVVNTGLLDNVGRIDPEPDGSAMVRLETGGRLQNHDGAELNCWVENDGGYLQNDGVAHICLNDGEITGNGSFELIVNNGLVSPGDGVGTMTTLAGYSGAGCLQIEIAGIEDHDVLSVGGPLELSEESLDLALVDGFGEVDLEWGDAFDIVTYGSPEQRTGEFAAVVDTLASLAEGLWELEYDHELIPGELYSIRLSYVRDLIAVPEPDLPPRYVLHAPYPNPFNPRLTIPFDLPQADDVHLEIFDMAGRRVWARGSGEVLTAGRHDVTWDGMDQAGRALPSGSYLLRMHAGEFQGFRRVVLIR